LDGCNNIKVMKILITGATGFVGARLLRRLEQTHEIWTLSRHAPVLASSNVHALTQDLVASDWAVTLPKSIDAVIHLAQSSAFRHFPASAVDIYAVSTGSAMRLLDWAHRAGARQFILGSTGGLYGTSSAVVSESSPIPDQRGQLGFYFAGKRSSEILAGQYAGQFNVATLRFFFVYGSGQPKEMLMPRLASNIQTGQPVILQGEDGIRINPIHVDDAVLAIEQCLTLGESRVINIAGPEVATLRTIAQMMGDSLGRAPVFMVDKIATPNHLVADITRMARVLGMPKIGVKAGIAELLAQPYTS
jgi:UDP-glucose 4-epimerase